MNFAGSSRRERRLLVEITPMIDVVFLLIIFFMMTAQFARQSRVDLELPKEAGEQDPSAADDGLVINILASGEIIVGQRTVDLDELEVFVKQEIARREGADAALGAPLLIRADANGDTAVLNAVVSRVQRLGVGAARLGTESPG